MKTLLILCVGVLLAIHATCQSTTPKSRPGYEDAIFLAMSKTFQGKANPLKYDKVLVDRKDSYDSGAGRYWSREGGLYWVSMSAGARTLAPVAYTLWHDGEHRLADIYRESREHNGNDTLSREFMLNLAPLDTLTVESAEFNGLFSDAGYQTSLSLFRLTGLLKYPNISFSVFRTSETTEKDGAILKFNKIVINDGNHFNVNDSVFVVPQTGIYFFSLSAGVKRYAKYDCTFRVNRGTPFDLTRNSKKHNGIDQISRPVLMRLSRGQKVQLTLESQSIAYADKGAQTAFSGFLYEPTHNRKVAWTVTRIRPWFGALDPVDFDEVLVNEGSAWNSTFDKIEVPVSGLYYLSISTSTYAKRVVGLEILRQGFPVTVLASLKRTASLDVGKDSLSRSVIVNLKRGETLTIRCAVNSGFYSDVQRQMAFNGFLLYPD